MHDDAKARQVELRAFVRRQLQQPNQVSGHELGMGHRVLLDRPQGLDRVETLQDDGGATQPKDRVGPAGRGGVVERSGGEVAITLLETVDKFHQRDEGTGLTQRAPTEGGLMPLGLPVVPEE